MGLLEGLKDQVLGWAGIALLCLIGIGVASGFFALISLIGWPAFIVGGFVIPLVISIVVGIVWGVHD